MCVARQILENLFWSTEWPFGVYYPFALPGLPAQHGEGRRFGQRLQLTVKSQFAALERPLQIDQELVPEEAAENLNLTGRKNDFFRQAIQREPSLLTPPPGTTQ